MPDSEIIQAQLWLTAISHSLAPPSLTAWQKRIVVCPSGELRESFAACCDVADPFFYLAGEFSSLRGVSMHTLAPVDISQKKVVRDPCFSML